MTIKCEALVKIYGGVRVVDQVDLTVNRGEVIGLLGPNGAGKTTTFYMVVGLIRPDGGQVLLDGEPLTSRPMHERARLGIGYLSQEASIFRKLSVSENIMAILEVRKKMTAEQRQQRLEELLEEFNIAHLRDRRGFKLSGGERRRVEIARALATEPDFILLDEPFTGVDPIAIEDIQDIIGYLQEKGLGVLITDHSVRETLSITDRAYIMHQGEILLSGNSEEIADSELARKFYLGEKFTM